MNKDLDRMNEPVPLFCLHWLGIILAFVGVVAILYGVALLFNGEWILLVSGVFCCSFAFMMLGLEYVVRAAIHYLESKG